MKLATGDYSPVTCVSWNIWAFIRLVNVSSLGCDGCLGYKIDDGEMCNFDRRFRFRFLFQKMYLNRYYV